MYLLFYLSTVAQVAICLIVTSYKKESGNPCRPRCRGCQVQAQAVLCISHVCLIVTLMVVLQLCADSAVDSVGPHGGVKSRSSVVGYVCPFLHHSTQYPFCGAAKYSGKLTRSKNVILKIMNDYLLLPLLFTIGSVYLSSIFQSNALDMSSSRNGGYN